MKRGFTYIELLIALAILGVLFVPVMHLFSYSVHSSGESRDLITATNLARWQMERLKNLGLKKEELVLMEDEIYPPEKKEPMIINNTAWRIRRDIKEETDPVEVSVSVYREGMDKPVITVVTLFEDTYWSEIKPIR